ncbi:MAG TPA: carboxypeptidase regulatory-like domain-containing protein [Candidatus Polarisedimenticolia bacterium]|nr:carboxypeptidase regulatory-like domain-containing protein [Candidatus Polarisedimenticolia bacterium]
MRTHWMSPLAAAAIATLVACGGGGEQQTESRRSRAGSGEGGAAAPAGGGGNYMVAAVGDAGTVSGSVKFQGTPPPAETVEVSKDNAVCGESKVLETVQVDPSGGLSSVVVWIDGISKGKDWGPLGAGTVDQKECHYSPYVQIVKAGESLDIVNSDPVLHNVHAYANDTETLFNLAQPTKGMRTPRKMDKTGPVHLKCDVHSWMSAWVFVAGHPYYTVTGADGSFSLPDVPAGTYKLKAWHAKFGEKTADVTVSAGGAATAEFSMP